MLEFGAKRIRSAAIREYMERNGYKRAVCFSCGNASAELRAAGVDVLAVCPNGDLTAGRWFTQAEVGSTFAGMFDATSGHLPAELMRDIAERFREHLGELSGEYDVPTGSGETLVCLCMAYPDASFNAVYNIDSATEYSPAAPLNMLVRALAASVRGL